LELPPGDTLPRDKVSKSLMGADGSGGTFKGFRLLVQECPC